MNAKSLLLIGVRRSKTPLLGTLSTQTSDLTFRQLPVVNGSAFQEVPKQTRQPREVNPSVRKFSLISFLSIQPCSQNLQGVGVRKNDSKGEVDGWW